MPTSLQRQLYLTLAAGFVLILGLYQTLFTIEGIVLVSATWLWHWSVIWRNRHTNRVSEDTPLLPYFGVPNWLSIIRGFINSVLIGYIFADFADVGWLPTILYTTSTWLDFFDGLVARITKKTTLLGNIIDLEYDGVGVLIVVLVCLGLGQLPMWFVVVGLARYLYVVGLRWRERNNLPTFPAPDSNSRRPTAGMMMAYLTVILWPLVDQNSARVASYVFGTPFLLGFLRDWFIRVGTIDANNALYQKARGAYKEFVEFILPQIARITVVLLAASPLVTLDFTSSITWFGVAGLFLTTFGILARVGAAGILVLAVLGDGSHVALMTMLICATFIAHSGLRRYSLWVPEERIFAGRLG